METERLVQGTKRRQEGEHTKRIRAGSLDEPTRLASLVDDGVTMNVEPPVGIQSAQNAASEGRDEHYYRYLYTTEPDFLRLGQKYPEFGTMLRDGTHLDFSDPAAIVQLTKTLLQEDFGLQVHLLPDRLCPPVPNRHNYILWLKDLLDSTSSSYSEQYEPGRRVTGLDIGTGASLIYPLLGCTQRSAWHFLATDIDAASLANARTNARTNQLESRICVVARNSSDPLIPLNDLGIDTLDFIMVNPPFYSSPAEVLDLAAQKSLPPHGACSGAPVEMICDGGEVGFIERMICESLELRDRVQWYTAMVGKQSSLSVLIDLLRKHAIHNFAVTTFTQGSKTRRWALGWSFSNRRPSLSASRGCSTLAHKEWLPPITAVTIYGPSLEPHMEFTPSAKEILCSMMESLDLRSWKWDNERLRGVGFADGNVWSRAYRRRRTGDSLAAKQNTAAPQLDITACAFGFSLSIQPAVSAEPGDRYAVALRWLQGDDESLFESFTGVIRRCLRKDATRPD